MPRSTRNSSTSYLILEHEPTSKLLVAKHLANRLYAAEVKAKVDLTCQICLEVCSCPHCATYLVCGHGVFHVQCVMALRQASCPICRS